MDSNFGEHEFFHAFNTPFRHVGIFRPLIYQYGVLFLRLTYIKKNNVIFEIFLLKHSFKFIFSGLCYVKMRCFN